MAIVHWDYINYQHRLMVTRIMMATFSINVSLDLTI